MTWNIYDALNLVRDRPWAFLEQTTLGHLSTYLLAVQSMAGRLELDNFFYKPDFRHFDMWIAAKRGEGLETGGWRYFLANEPTEQAGFDLFFVELELFRRSNLRTIATASVSPQKPWPDHVDWPIDGGTQQVQSRSPVENLALKSYDTVDSYFLVVLRSDNVATEHWCWTRDRAEEFALTEFCVSPQSWTSSA